MTRSERWIYVGVCVVLYALAMALLTWAIREPTRWIVDGLIASVGNGWMLALVCFPGLAAFVWAMWPDPSYTPAPSANARGPRWARYLGNAYLALLGIGLVIVFGAIIYAG